MRRTIMVVTGVLMLGGCAWAQDNPTKQAEKAAQNWLLLVDKGDYAASYDEVSSFFKSVVTKEQWKKALAASRGSFGKLLSRKLKSADFRTSLPTSPNRA